MTPLPPKTIVRPCLTCDGAGTYAHHRRIPGVGQICDGTGTTATAGKTTEETE